MFNIISRNAIRLGALAGTNAFAQYGFNTDKEKKLPFPDDFFQAKTQPLDIIKKNSSCLEDRQLSLESKPWFFKLFPQTLCAPENKLLETPVYTFTTPTKNLNDLQGYEEIIYNALDIVLYMQNPKKFEDLGIKQPNGLILNGPPGVGKSLLAECIAGHAGVRFILISGSEFKAPIQGVAEEKLKALFQQAQEKAPCIICIDEIDSLGTNRFTTTVSTYERSITNQLLTLLSQDHPGVFVIGTTNNLKSLDSALIRPGRFDRHLTLPIPNEDGRQKILELHTKGKKLASNVTLKDLAACSRGFSGAKIAAWVNEAAICALKENSSTLNLNHFNKARFLLSGGIMGASSANPEQKKRIATRESGHALIAKLLNQEVYMVSIRKTTTGFGFTEILPHDDDSSLTQQDLLDLICIRLGGRAAEQLCNCVQTGSSLDIDQAKEIISLMKKERMISYNEQVVEKILIEQMNRALELLENNKNKLENIIKTLIDFEILDKEQFLLALENKNLNHFFNWLGFGAPTKGQFNNTLPPPSESPLPINSSYSKTPSPNSKALSLEDLLKAATNMKDGPQKEASLLSLSNEFFKDEKFRSALEAIKAMKHGSQRENSLLDLSNKCFDVKYCSLTLEAIRTMKHGSQKEQALLDLSNKLLDMHACSDALEALEYMKRGPQRENALLALSNKFFDVLETEYTLSAIQTMKHGSQRENALLALSNKFFDVRDFSWAVHVLKKMLPGIERDKALLILSNKLIRVEDFTHADSAIHSMTNVITKTERLNVLKKAIEGAKHL